MRFRCLAVAAFITATFGTTFISAHSSAGEERGKDRRIVSLALQGNTISGFVFDSNRRPLEGLFVELQTDVRSFLRKTRTDGSGRYLFSGVSSGTFYIRVLAIGTNFEEQTQEVNIVNFSDVNRPGGISAPDHRQVDFTLQPAKNGNAVGAGDAIFVQDVPPQAKRLYETGVANLENGRKEMGLAELRQSLETFPDYYVALDRLGNEYLQIGLTNGEIPYFEAALVLLTKSATVNSRSYTSFYGLGVCKYNLKQMPEAVKNLEKAVSLKPDSVNAIVLLGMALHQTGNLAEAEKILVKAKKLAPAPIADVQLHLAKIYERLKRYADAAKELEALIPLQTDTAKAESLRQLIQRLRDKAKANGE
jgi:tetratricopeptide (TPR) repeat protein